MRIPSPHPHIPSSPRPCANHHLLPSSLSSSYSRYLAADPNPPKQEGSSIFQSIENPYALQEAINKLEGSLDEVIRLFQGERETLASDGGFEKGKEGIALFR